MLNWFTSKKKKDADVNPWVKKLKWIPAAESPFGVRVLDCRVLAETAKVTIRDRAVADRFYQSRQDDGKNYIGQLPRNAVTVKCSLNFSAENELSEGPVFKAAAPEIKWDIYYFPETLYFVRSWSGDLIFTAPVVRKKTSFSVTSVAASPEVLAGDSYIAVEQVRYLIKSHIFNEIAPHPVPAGYSNDPREIAIYSVTCYGAKALYATFDKPQK